jgi:carboxyl-terminal processing protease
MRWLSPIFAVLALVLPLQGGAKPPELTPQGTKGKIEEILRAHSKYHALNQDLTSRSLENFLHELDPSFSYLIEPDIVKWKNPPPDLTTQFLAAYGKADFSLFEEIFDQMVTAIHRRRSIEKKIDAMTPPTDVDGDEFKEMSWTKTLDELENRILRIKGLHLKTAAKVLDAEGGPLFLQRLNKRRLSREEELLTPDPKARKCLVLSYVLKAIAAALDSQTSYFTPSEANQFMIQVQQRLFGIGAQLRDDLDGFTIVRILEDSPLSHHPHIQIGDRIVAVNHEPTIGLDLSEAVEFIRGPQGTSVHLTFLRKKEDKTEEKYDVVITRGEVVLKESRLETHLQPFGKGVIGIIHLSSFYQDSNYSSASDMAAALSKLKKENQLKGVILDLRNNAGGVLAQSVAVAGLFMKKGVVVSVKDNTGAIQKLRNVDSEVVWDGPLTILTNKTSASAAEIVAQTLQEYGRALIVGDATTFGKGTFQTFTLETSHFGRVNPTGEYKVTRGCYYTVSGKTPQLVGVASDIVVPGLFSTLEIGEKFSKYPLEPDQISPSFEDDLSDIPAIHRPHIQRLYKFDLQQVLNTYRLHLPQLTKNSSQRLLLNQNYQNFLNALSKQDLSQATSFGERDLQLQESLNIMKDLVMLQLPVRK